jgi:hypothetical protein
MVDRNEETQSEWGELKNLASQKTGKRVGGHELGWGKDSTGNALLILNSVAAVFYNTPRSIRFSSTPQLKSLSPSIHFQVGPQPIPVTWSLRPSNKAGKFAWAVDDEEFGEQKKLTTAELSEAIETKLQQFLPIH